MKINGISILACIIPSLTMSSACFAVPQTSLASDTVVQPAPADQLSAIRAACAGDVQKLCATVQSGGGRVVACLKDHKDSLSDACQQAAGTRASAPDSKATPASKASSAPVTVAGERFVKRTLIDAQQGGMKAVTIRLPEN